MSPTILYDPEAINTIPAVRRSEMRASLPKPPRRRFQPSSSQTLLAAFLSVSSILLICGALLVCAEVTLGLVGLGDDEYIKVDPILGISHLENKWVDFRQEGFSRTKISSAGLRDIEHQLAKPTGVQRIAFLGDSKTQALQVSLEDTFVRLVENNLNAQEDHKKFETINFGMSNYGLVQYFVNYLARVRPYSPDVTVVVYHIFDSRDNVPRFGQQTLPSPTLSLNNRDELAIDYHFLDGWLHTDGAKYMIASEWLRRNSHLFQALSADDFMLRTSSKWYTNIFAKLMAPFSGSIENTLAHVPLSELGSYDSQRKAICDETRALDKQVSHDDIWMWTVKPRLGKIDAPGIDEHDSFKLSNDTARSEVNLAGRVFRMLNLACRNAGSKLVIVTLPAPDNMLFYVKEIQALKKLAAQEGITIIDANAQFPSLSPMEQSPLYYRSHFTPAGHRKLANIITEGLKPILNK